MQTHHVFVTGATGYLGSQISVALAQRRHTVRVLVRPGSEKKAPPLCEVVVGNALQKESFAGQIKPSDTFLQLVGVPHPSPAKAKLFREIDLVSVRASVAAAREANVEHFVYISVAQPAPIMKAYQAVRAEGEALIRASGLRATILRPWYILGPGHRWPQMLRPIYWLCSQLPATRAGAQRLGLVTLDQMVDALLQAVENPPANHRIMEVPEIRSAVLGGNRAGPSW